MKKYMVFFDDGGCLCVPMGADSECDGALEANGHNPVWFESRADARRAIRISQAKARLDAAQGKPVNSDFTPECKGCIKAVPVTPYQHAKGGE